MEVKYNLLLADDDEDDFVFFKDALDDLPLSVALTIVSDGVELIDFLARNANQLPDILFLDLNMPRKSGFNCLSEIKLIDKLKNLPVIIFSTSLDMNVVDLVYKTGAIYYIRKPGDFSKLKKVIFDAITFTFQNNFKQAARDSFILHP